MNSLHDLKSGFIISNQKAMTSNDMKLYQIIYRVFYNTCIISQNFIYYIMKKYYKIELNNFFTNGAPYNCAVEAWVSTATTPYQLMKTAVVSNKSPIRVAFTH